MADDAPPPAYTISEPYPLPTLSTLPFPVLTLVVHHLVSSPRSALERAEVQQWLIREARFSSRMLYAGQPSPLDYRSPKLARPDLRHLSLQ